MPNVLLARYFHARGLFGEFDFAGMKETQPDSLFEAWLPLEDSIRRAMDTEFREIFELSCEKGFHAIIDEAESRLSGEPGARDAFVALLAGLANDSERAMTTFLDHREFWKGATHFYHADSLAYWRKRKNIPRVEAAVDDAGLRELARQISDYFHRTEGRGKNCVVEPFRRADRDYFFAYPEDYSKQSIEWVDDEFGRRPHNPAFEIIYVYSREEGSLDLHLQGSRKAVEPLQAMFSAVILNQAELPPDPKDTRVYDLNPLLRRGFEFVYETSSGIRSVAVKKLRLSSKVKRGDRITVEADARAKRDSIYDLLDQIGDAVPLRLYNVTQVELAAKVVVDPEKEPKTMTIRITHPNTCSLKYDEPDLELREMLYASGIEPKEPEEPLETSASTEGVESPGT